MWSHIKFADLAFEEKQVAASMMHQITKDDVIKFFKKVFLSTEHTGKLSLQIYGKGMIQ
jgi:secreted Zn-dependent insulinase-like peptidase